MSITRYLLLLLLLHCFALGKAQVLDSVPSQKSFLNLSLIGMLSTNGEHYREKTNNILIGLIHGGAKNVHGVSLSPFNTVELEMYGLQLGLMNGVKDLRGVQIGVGNRTETLKGVQIGLMNDAEVSAGIQLGGFNFAGQVRGGAQIGIVNVANHNDYPIGIINIVKDGDMSVGFYTDEMSSIVATFRSGGRCLYGIVGLGYSFGSSNNHAILDMGVGAHLHLLNRLRIDTEISFSLYSRLMKPMVGKSEEEMEEETEKHDFKAAYRTSIRVLPNYRIGRHIEVFAGPTVNYLHSKHVDGGRMFPSNYWWRSFKGSSHKQIYLGWVAGLQYKF